MSNSSASSQSISIPYSLETERAALGCVLIDSRSVYSLLTGVKEEHFYSRNHQVIYRAIQRLNERGSEIDLTLLCDWLAQHGELETVGGPPYIASLEDAVYVTENLQAYCKAIKSVWRMRKAIEAARRLSSEWKSEASMEEAIDRGIKDLTEIRTADCETTVATAERLEEHFVDALQARESALCGVMPTAWVQYNRLAGGYRPKSLAFWSGVYHSGKTSLALCAALALAAQLAHGKQPGGVVFISLEEPLETIQFNSVSCVTASTTSAIDTYSWHQTPLPSALARRGAELYSSHIKARPFSIIAQTAISAEQIEHVLRDAAKQWPVRAVFLDYVQKIALPRAPKGQSTSEEWGHRYNANYLADLAHSGRIPGQPCIVCTAQEDSGRGKSSMERKRDMESATGTPRNAQAYYGACDLYAVLQRPDMNNLNDAAHESVECTLAIKRCRGGKLGNVKLRFEKRYGYFYEDTFDAMR